MKEVKPIYFELQGYLAQAPEREQGVIFEREVWVQHNQTIEELENITGKKYDRYKLQPGGNYQRGPGITVQAYRTILGGLISRLHGEYFPDEVSPIR
jgi:hypothetical protein